MDRAIGPALFLDTEVRDGRILGTGSYCDVVAIEDIIAHGEEEENLPTEALLEALLGGTTSSPGSAAVSSSEASRRRLMRAFREGRVPSKAERREAAIHGKGGPPESIEDPSSEPAPRLVLKRCRADLGASRRATAQEDLRSELAVLLHLSRAASTVRITEEKTTHDQSSSTTEHHPSIETSSGWHPNIIEFYGVGYDRAVLSEGDPSFLVLGRLRCTLAQKIAGWREAEGSFFWGALPVDVAGRRARWVERLVVGAGIARALSHLHAHGILYRDTKPENVGLDAWGRPRLYDFGLATVLTDDRRVLRDPYDDSDDSDSDEEEEEDDPTTHTNNTSQRPPRSKWEDDLWRLTPETGTLRYMAVEVGKGRPYGTASDVYSFAILLHEILGLRVPFGGIAPRRFRQAVWNEAKRPDPDASWPRELSDLLRVAWDPDATKRPPMEEAASRLEQILRGPDAGLFPRGLVPPASAAHPNTPTTPPSTRKWFPWSTSNGGSPRSSSPKESSGEPPHSPQEPFVV